MIDSVLNIATLRLLRGGLGALTGVLLCVLVLPTSVQGQSPVQSLIADGEAAGADAARMRTVASRAERAGLSPQQTATLLKPAVSLAKRDLPSTPLLNKTLEGLAKQVPSQRMTPVLQQLQTHTQEAGALISTWTQKSDARTLLGTNDGSLPDAARNQLIVNIAEARQQNVPMAEIETFLNELPGAVRARSVSANEVAAAVSVMPDLPTAASDPGTSRALLTAALNAGYDSESLRQMPVALERAQRTSARPAPSIAKSTAQAITKGSPAPKVLRTLFQGTVPNAPPASQNAAASSPPGQSNPPGEDGHPTSVDPPATQDSPPPPNGSGDAPNGPPSHSGEQPTAPPADNPSSGPPPGASSSP